MLFLIISIFASSLISIAMRLSQGKIKGKTSMLAANYLTCIIAAWFFIEDKNIFTPAPGMGLTLALGAVNGFFYMTSLMLSQYNIKKNGVVLPSVFSRIGGLLVPLLISIGFFGERPLVMQVIGAVLAIAAIIAMNYDPQQRQEGSMFSLLLLFLTDGFAGAMTKIYDGVGNIAYSSHFLLYTFGAALLLCLAVIIYQKERPGIWELVFGIMIGVPNYFASRFLLLALNTVPAVIAYPLRSVGSIVVVALAGLFLFHEKLRKTQWYAIAVIMVAVVLLSI